MIPLAIWGTSVALPTLTAIATEVAIGMAVGAIVYGAYKSIDFIATTGKDASFNPYGRALINQYVAREEKYVLES